MTVMYCVILILQKVELKLPWYFTAVIYSDIFITLAPGLIVAGVLGSLTVSTRKTRQTGWALKHSTLKRCL